LSAKVIKFPAPMFLRRWQNSTARWLELIDIENNLQTRIREFQTMKEEQAAGRLELMAIENDLQRQIRELQTTKEEHFRSRRRLLLEEFPK
jgi:hypothetical protein